MRLLNLFHRWPKSASLSIHIDLQSIMDQTGSETTRALTKAYPAIFQTVFIAKLESMVNDRIEQFMGSKVAPKIDACLNKIDIEEKVIVPIEDQLETAVRQASREGADKARQIVSSQINEAITKRFADVNRGAVIADAILDAMAPKGARK